METRTLTHRAIVAKIRELSDEIHLIKSLPSATADTQGEILLLLNNQLEKELKDYHKLLMEIKIED